MFTDFYCWLYECYSWGDLSDQEIEDAINDTSDAYDLFMDYAKTDFIGFCHEVQSDLIRLQKELKNRKKDEQQKDSD